jgi:hypothetical protein
MKFSGSLKLKAMLMTRRYAAIFDDRGLPLPSATGVLLEYKIEIKEEPEFAGETFEERYV